MMRAMLGRRAALLLCAVVMLALPARAAERLATENVIFFMTDGLRWQEVFGGADGAFMNETLGQVKDLVRTKSKFWRETPEARREALLPFFWEVVAKEGQLFGNFDAGSIAEVTNGLNFSYPGYSEILCGYVDPKVDSNNKIPNPNVTVLEWLHGKKAFKGKVAAFGAWDVFPSIFNARRCGFPVNAGYDPMPAKGLGNEVVLLNRLKSEMTRYWAGEPFDPLTYHTAMAYLRAEKPRVLFLSLGETDEWAHGGRYDLYLDSAHMVDAYVRELWETVQSMPRYRNKTTLILATDHGRGDPPLGWRSHGKDTPRSEKVWYGFLGPDTPALGVRTEHAPVYQTQIAATLAAFLGEDYPAGQPLAGQPLPGVINHRGSR